MANQDPWPYMPPQSTEMLLLHCDDTAYTATPDTILYKLVDAICGTTGAGALVNEIFLARAAGALETIYFNDLDYIFSKVNFLSRAPEESYPYNPLTDLLTADQWNEIRAKDAWYRARVRDFFIACGLGTTLAGIKMCVQAALAVDCDVFEVWRYVDNFGLTSSLGRAPVSARNELVVKPHKQFLLPQEFRLVRDMLDKMVSLDTIVTVDVDGLSVRIPVTPTAAAADSTYYEVQKVITPTPLMSQLPPPSQLPIDLLPSEQWMYSKSPTIAPYAAFNMTQEYGYFYLIGGGSRSPIDSVIYGTINSPIAAKIAVFEMIGTSTVAGQTVKYPSTSWVQNALNADLFQYTPIVYQADQYPMQDCVDAGVTTLISAINAYAGSFVIVGAGIGAIIASDVYDEIRTGSLADRRPQFLGGVAFGNARRQAGHTFPGSTYSHGHGIHGSDLLTASESLWWEFVVPEDKITDVTSAATEDVWLTRLFEVLYPNYSGNVSAITPLVIPPVPNATTLLHSILGSFYGEDSPNDPHSQYQGYQPLLPSGDHRSCTQIAADYVASLAGKSLAAVGETLTALPVSVYEVGGTELTSATDSWFSASLSPDMKYIWTPWPASSYPLASSLATGVNNLITQINRNPGKFVLVGHNSGAIVVSHVYAQLQSGALQHRQADLLGVVTFSSPTRQAGHTFPGCSDPGGHGISATRMSSTPSLWWDFADPNDVLAVDGDDTNGTWLTTLFDAIVANYAGDSTVVVSAYPGAPVNTVLLSSRITNLLFRDGATVDYSLTTPLADTGDNRTSFEIARDYINTFADQSSPYVASPSDPMNTYQAESNFESFSEVNSYGPFQTYEVADSPDNYPGGKFGKHRASPPAINPDGTPYNFPWASQAAYIAFKSAQVIAMGGQADTIHYRLPSSGSSVTKEIFLPEYSIAYSAPAMDSTVSQSLTARRGKTINQSGSNQTFARVTTS